MQNSQCSMIHEVLFALQGNTGNFFHFTGTKLLVNSELPLAPGERVLINRVLAVAVNYKRLKEFVDGIVMSHAFSDKPGSGPTGKSEHYLLALCSGLAEVLELYRKAVDAMEEVILLDPHQSITFVLSVVDEYACLLKVLNYIVDKVEADGSELTGCRILELLHRNSLSVVANVQLAVQRVQSRCHEVLFKQLASWLFQGHLSDQQFFIQRVHLTESSSDIELLEENGFYTAYSDFRLCSNLLPSYIPFSLALSILYVGQTVVMIQQNPKNVQDGSSLQKPEIDVWGGRDLEFLQELQVMQNASTFQLDRLTWLVDAARLCVTQHLWRLAVCDARLLDEVKLIKDLYLLGRGELFLEFIRLADAALSVVPTQLTLKEMNQALRTAARNIHWEEEGLFEKIHLTLMPESKKGWDGLTLRCNVQWPLHLLFNDAAFVNYNLLFRFLLRARRAQRNLHALWKSQMQEKLLVGCEKNPELWQLRRNFNFLVDNLQYYLQVDVLESQYSTFINAISSTDKFEDVQQAHSKALASIMSQTFLLGGKSASKSKVKSEYPEGNQPSNPVMKCLIALLDLSSEFCICARSIESGNETNELSAQLKSINDSFIKHVGLLKQLLVGLRGQPSGTALSQLLLRLDFNSWISDHCVTIDNLVS